MGKRLTKKGHNGTYIQNCANCDLKNMQKCTNSNCFSMMLNRLGELENKIEELENNQLPQCKNCSQKSG